MCSLSARSMVFLSSTTQSPQHESDAPFPMVSWSWCFFFPRNSPPHTQNNLPWRLSPVHELSACPRAQSDELHGHQKHHCCSSPFFCSFPPFLFPCRHCENATKHTRKGYCTPTQHPPPTSPPTRTCHVLSPVLLHPFLSAPMQTRNNSAITQGEVSEITHTQQRLCE